MTLKTTDSERKEFISEFVNSSRELLDEVEPQILALEKHAADGSVDAEILNSIFRLFHTLKGSSAFINLSNITSVTHEAETLLDIFRKENVNLQPEHIDLLCKTSDFIRNILDAVEKQLDDSGFESEANKLIADLKNVILSIGKENNVKVQSEESSVKTKSQSDQSEEELTINITPEMALRFVQETNDLCEEAEMMLLAFERVPDNLELANNAFRALHSIKGNAGFFGYSALEKVAHAAENILDSLRNGTVKPDKAIMTAMLSAIDFLRMGAKILSAGEQIPISEINNVLRKICEVKEPANAEICELVTESDVNENKEIAQSQVLIQQQHQVEQVEKQATKQLVEHINETKTTLSEQSKQKQSVETATTTTSTHQQYIRVDTTKLDLLLDLVGEMVIAESMVANCPDLKGLQLERFEKAIHHLNKITRDIQDMALSMRMIPLSSTFQKMERLVRDLSNKLNKKVKLEIYGSETEVDKTIIEQISDPLVHIIRNAIDHGLESEEDRIKAGKPAIGTVKLEAKHSAGEVWIIIEDDGRGLNREKIIKKAIEKGLIRGDGSDLKDEDVWKLIFEPGFSTADQVSSVSGRGVGMDVVKKNIEKLRGRVDIKTKKGEGTTIILRIPLTLAIIDGMEIMVGKARYIIPMNSIRQSLKIKPEQITQTPDGSEIVNVRGELLPVIRLHKIYSIPSTYEKLEDGLLIIVESNERKCCLFVDELVGQQQIVIKALSNYLGKIKGISGCAIMGDGEISLILDVGDLINSIELEAA